MWREVVKREKMQFVSQLVCYKPHNVFPAIKKLLFNFILYYFNIVIKKKFLFKIY